jgi:nucleoside-diphosphate-sugar epimerase
MLLICIILGILIPNIQFIHAQMSQEKKVKILLTGGAGFVGSNLVDALLRDARVDLVRVLDNFSNGKKKNLNAWINDPRLEIMEGDIRDLSVCQQASVSNAVQANVLSLFSDFPNGTANVYNVACGYRTTINQLWKALAELSGTALSPVHVPMREGDILTVWQMYPKLKPI